MIDPNYFSVTREETVVLANQLRSLRDYEDGIVEDYYQRQVFYAELNQVLKNSDLTYGVKGSIAKWYERFPPARLWLLANAPVNQLSAIIDGDTLVSEPEVKAFFSNPLVWETKFLRTVNRPVLIIAYALTGPGDPDEHWGMPFELRDYLCHLVFNRNENVLEFAHEVFVILENSEGILWKPTQLIGWIRRNYDLQYVPDSYVIEFTKTLVSFTPEGSE